MFIERSSRYWVSAISGKRDEQMFAEIVRQTWEWVKSSQSIRWFTDRERRYGNELWRLAAVWLSRGDLPTVYDLRKVWHEGLAVAMKIKGSLGVARRVWLKAEHPWTVISPEHEVHANHREAHNAALRRRCSDFRRRQNLYAETLEGLERPIAVQRLLHNWMRPH